jgi:hypothetical protein
MSEAAICLKDADAYAEGGAVGAANKVKDAGRYGDDMVIHVNRNEFDALRKQWGEPTTNPDTGMPEFFLSGLKGWLKDNPWVAPVASTVGSAVLGPLAGEAIGALGVPAQYASLAGSALTGGTIGALTGGGLKGGLTGAALGATAGPYLGNFLAGTDMGSSLGLKSATTIGDLLGGYGKAATPGVSSSTGLRSEAAMDAAKTSGGSGSGGILSGLTGSGSTLPLLLGGLAVAGAAGSAFSKPKAAAGAPASGGSAAGTQPGYNSHLQQVDFNRENKSGEISQADYYTYGQRPAKTFFTNNKLPSVNAYAAGGGVSEGGDVRQLTQAPPSGNLDGRSDQEQALVSPGEYIFDAESVSLLGNGNTDAGVQALDEFRVNLRKQKGAALAKGEVSPDALPPESYLRSAG